METEDHNLIQIGDTKHGPRGVLRCLPLKAGRQTEHTHTHPIIQFVSSLVELISASDFLQKVEHCFSLKSPTLSVGKNEVDQIDTVSCMFFSESSGANVTKRQVRYG